ncbi:unnamed protein product, partial [Strongylus vulgaris]
RLRGSLQHQQERSEASVENKVKGEWLSGLKHLLMNAQVEQQRLAKQLSQPPSTYLSTSSKTVRGPPSLPGSRLVGRTPDAQYATIKNEAEEVVSSTTTSIDTSHSGLRPLAPRPSSSQTTRDLAKVVGQNLVFFVVTVYVNYSCRLGPFLDPTMVAGIRRQFGPFATHHALREAVQQLLNCSKDDAVVLNLVQPAAVTQILSVTAHCGGTPRSRFIPCVKSSADAWTYIKQLLKKMKVCENFYSSSPDPCTSCSPGNDMSVEQVLRFQQIDGRSLGLLTTELLMSHMGLALGPALKVIDFVSSIKKAQEYQRTASDQKCTRGDPPVHA